MVDEPSPAAPATPCEVVASEIRKYSGWDHEVMTAVAIAENRECDPLNHNLTLAEDHGVCIGSYNVLQVGCVHYDGEDPDDLAINVKIAYEVWQKQGYTAWTQYNEGEYLRYL